MADGQTMPKLRPPVRFWYEDQPEDEASSEAVGRVGLSAFGNLRHIDKIYLEISRAEALVRGVGIFGILITLAGYAASMYFSFMLMSKVAIAFVFLFLVLGHFFLIGTLWFFRIDFLTPSNTPMRFNCARNKVYIYEHAWRWNPFVRWPINIKVFDWHQAHGEITRQAGTNGTSYAVRYALFLSQSKPGTLEVEDRVQMGGATLDVNNMRRLWDYCRLYMARGPAALPQQPIRPDDVNFRRCFFFFMPGYDPTAEGRMVRANLGFAGWVIFFLCLPLFWFFFPLGLMRYAALKLSPRPKWPADIDAESRSAPVVS